MPIELENTCEHIFIENSPQTRTVEKGSQNLAELSSKSGLTIVSHLAVGNCHKLLHLLPHLGVATNAPIATLKEALRQ